MPQRMWGIGLGDPGQPQIAGHAVLDLPGTQREASLPAHPTGEDIQGHGALKPLPLPEGFGDIRGQIHHPILLPFAVVNPDRALGEVER